MKIPKARLLLLGCLTLLFSSRLSAQLYEVSLDEKINHSELIVEGKVVSQESFWNADHSFIFTSNKIIVTKTFKGSLTGSYIEIVTQGGTVEDRHIEASDLLKLQKDELGVFFCYKNAIGLRSPSTGNVLMDVYSSAQGFFKFDLATMSASAPFVHYSSIYHDLYPVLRKFSNPTDDDDDNKQSIIGISDDYAKISGTESAMTVTAPSITSFSPAMVTAGTFLDPANNILTINGSGFGNSPSGAAGVIFDNPDDGPGNGTTKIPYSSALILLWTDTQIRIRVPDGSGTGALQVADASGTIATAPTNLSVLFTIMAGDFFQNNTFFEARMVNYNGVGGYTVFYSTSTANSGVNINASPAKATFQRALNTWKEVTGFNVIEGGTTAIQRVDLSDDVNVVMFDNSATGNLPLADGVLATCYSGFGACSGDPAIAKVGFDIVIRSAYSTSSGTVTFTFGPCPPITTSANDVDLETVILHELGHALNLNHVIDGGEGNVFGKVNPGKVMNFAIARGRRRSSPDFAAASGAAYQVSSAGVSYCGGTVAYMTPYTRTLEPKDECPSTFPTTMTPLNTTVSFDLVHATSNKYADPAYTQVLTDGTGATITNNAYYAFKTGPAGGSLTLSVSGYTTTPTSIASCTTTASWIPATGIRMAIYQVSSCPAAQSYPTPIAYYEFAGDGAIPPISSLSANSTYLMMVDGIENTKATFSMNFAGSALPITKTDFSGLIRNDYNQLSWSLELDHNVKNISIQKSADGITFNKLANIEVKSEKLSGQLNDVTPIRGNNYYRLLIESNNGSIQYSKIILLKRTEAFMLNVYPNPATENINLDISAEPGRYKVVLHNIYGQILQQKTIHATSSQEHISLKIANYPAGLYHISVYDENGTRVGTGKVVK